MFKSVRRSTRVIALAGVIAASVVLASAPAAWAQQQLASVQGTIADQTGGVLPGVTVTATNVETGAVRSTVSNDVGVYRLPSLDPGRYDVVAELSGFKKIVRGNITLAVGAVVAVNFTLQPGDVTESITVTGVAGEIRTELAEVSAVVDRRKVQELPLVGRNVMALAALQPGINGTGGTGDFLSPEQGIGVTASGQRGSGNNATVDGMSINGTPWGGTVLLVPNAEAVQEFQVIANNQSAEFGRNSGAAISIITRGGTNEFKGSLYEFYRDKTLRAKGLFETTKPDFNRHNFGGSFGGPIKRDRTFMFASVEAVREISGSGALYTVETQEFVNFVTQTRPNSIAAKLLTTYKPPYYPTSGLRDLGSPAPGANVFGPADGIFDVGTISYAFRNKRDGNQYNGRLDQNLRDGKDRVRATYYYSGIETWYNYLRSAFNHPYPFQNHLFTASYSRVISNQTLNEMSVGYLRMHGEAGDPTPEAPTISISAVNAGFGVEFWHPIYFTQNNYEFKNTLTMARGAHSIRMGGEFRWGADDSEMHHWQRPNYSFTSILDFADDEPFTETRAVDPKTGKSTMAAAQYRTKEFGLFVQDNWKVRKNLTVNAGLRYEVFGSPTKGNGRVNAIVLGSGSTMQERVRNAKVAAVDNLYNTDWNNLAPRLGLAWDVRGDAKLVVRAGGGMAFNRINNTVWSDEKFNPPQFASAAGGIQSGVPMLYSLGPNYPDNPALGRGVDANGGIIGARVNLRVIDPDTVTPYAYNWFAGVQYELPWRIVVEANYIGSAGRKLMSTDGPGGEDYNRFSGDMLDGRMDRLNASFGQVALAESRVNSKYNGFTFQLNRRFHQGFSFQAAYTFGKAYDLPSSATEVTLPQLDYGFASHDLRQKLAMNLIWQAPSFENKLLDYTIGGWQVSAITFWQSGSRFSIGCGQPYPTCDWNGDGITNDRPNTPSFGTDLGSPDQAKWLSGVFVRSDFPVPALGTVGTLPRNAYTGPNYANTDLALSKTVPVPVGGRTVNVQLRAEAYNVFNQVNLNNPNSTMNSTLFGRVTSTRTMRTVQLGLRLQF